MKVFFSLVAYFSMDNLAFTIFFTTKWIASRTLWITMNMFGKILHWGYNITLLVFGLSIHDNLFTFPNACVLLISFFFLKNSQFTYTLNCNIGWHKVSKWKDLSVIVDKLVPKMFISKRRRFVYEQTKYSYFWYNVSTKFNSAE